VREIRYVAIADDLRRQVTAGQLAAGAVLPSEADLARAYAASRVTVRKALELLRREGLVDARQGFGWFVPADRVRQTLGPRSTIEAALAEQGREPVRKVLSFRFVDDELEVVRVNLADGQPFALVTVWCPAEVGRRLSPADVESSTFSDLLDVPVASARQVIRAAAADERDAEVLGVPVGSPLLVAERVSRGAAGKQLLRSELRCEENGGRWLVLFRLRKRLGIGIAPRGEIHVPRGAYAFEQRPERLDGQQLALVKVLGRHRGPGSQRRSCAEIVREHGDGLEGQNGGRHPRLNKAAC